MKAAFALLFLILADCTLCANPPQGPIPTGMVRIGPGTFTMGSPSGETGRRFDETQHPVTLTRAFCLQVTEVTKAQWDAVAIQGPEHGYTDLPTGRNGFNGDASGTHPVTEVSWFDVLKWLNLKSELERLIPSYTVDGAPYRTGQLTPDCTFSASGYRLPTESEWEYVCRAGTTTAFHSGAITETYCALDPNLDAIGWYCGNSDNNTHPVGGKEPNEWGLFDMSGNVWEWCWDWYGTYPETATDPVGAASGSLRVIRGGYYGFGAEACRSAVRGRHWPGVPDNVIGFRTVRKTNSVWGCPDCFANGWSFLPWFGYFAILERGWVYHLEHGYQYVVGSHSSSLHVFDEAIDCWFWTSAATYPYLYKFGNEAGWYWYYKGGTFGQRWFNRLSDRVDLQEGEINQAGTLSM